VAGRTDSSCMSLHLSILIDLQRFDEAAAAVRGVLLDEKWCDRAVMALVMTGTREEADRALTWAREREDPACYHRSLLTYVQALFFSACGGITAAERARPYEIDDGKKLQLRDALERLSVLLRSGDDDGRAKSGIEVEAHTLAARIALLTGDASRRIRSLEILGSSRSQPGGCQIRMRPLSSRHGTDASAPRTVMEGSLA
jgi:hypothetical protein